MIKLTLCQVAQKLLHEGTGFAARSCRHAKLQVRTYHRLYGFVNKDRLIVSVTPWVHLSNSYPYQSWSIWANQSLPVPPRPPVLIPSIIINPCMLLHAQREARAGTVSKKHFLEWPAKLIPKSFSLFNASVFITIKHFFFLSAVCFLKGFAFVCFAFYFLQEYM